LADGLSRWHDLLGRPWNRPACLHLDWCDQGSPSCYTSV